MEWVLACACLGREFNFNEKLSEEEEERANGRMREKKCVRELPLCDKNSRAASTVAVVVKFNVRFGWKSKRTAILLLSSQTHRHIARNDRKRQAPLFGD